MNTSYFRCPLQSLLVNLTIIYGNIPCNALGEYYTVLHHHATLSAPPFLVECIHITSANSYLTSLYGIIAQHQFNKGCLSAARSTHNGSYLTFGDSEAYIVNDRFQCVWVVFKVYVFHVYTLSFVSY